MALQVTWTNAEKFIEVPDAYIRVVRVVAKAAPKVKIIIKVYASEAQYDDGNGEPILTEQYILSDAAYTTTYMTGTGVNLFAKAYTYLQTLPEFSGAITV